MACRDYDRYIQLYVDQEINDADRLKLLEHVRVCERCRRELNSMVTLVTSLEDIQEDLSLKASLHIKGFLKWTAVCAVAVSAIFLILPLTHHTPLVKQDEMAPALHSVLVLAAEEEAMPIPTDESVQVIRPGDFKEMDYKSDTTLVYPSAVQTFVEKNRHWNEYTRRFIFVHVPDEQTMTKLLEYAGVEVGHISQLKQLTYPTSVEISLEDTSQIAAFTLPKDGLGLSVLLEMVQNTVQPMDSASP